MPDLDGGTLAAATAANAPLVTTIDPLAVGVISGGSRIKGSCGGLSQGSGDVGCSICGGKCEDADAPTFR